jgi:hypothetical protein
MSHVIWKILQIWHDASRSTLILRGSPAINSNLFPQRAKYFPRFVSPQLGHTERRGFALTDVEHGRRALIGRTVAAAAPLSPADGHSPCSHGPQAPVALLAVIVKVQTLEGTSPQLPPYSSDFGLLSGKVVHASESDNQLQGLEFFHNRTSGNRIVIFF